MSCAYCDSPFSNVHSVACPRWERRPHRAVPLAYDYDKGGMTCAQCRSLVVEGKRPGTWRHA